MTASHTRGRGRFRPDRRVLIAGIVAAALFGLPGAVAATNSGSHPSTSCAVSVKGAHSTYATVQAALDASPAGATILVRGTCVGATVVSRDAIIRAASDRPSDRAILDGADAATPLTISVGATLRLEHVSVTRGFSEAPADGGGGILNNGTFVMKQSTVTESDAQRGGGIMNMGDATILDSTIDHNGLYEGGNIYNIGTLVVKDSTITRGVGRFGQGLLNAFGGSATLIRTEVSHGDAGLPFSGGGIENHGDLTLIESEVSHNVSLFGGGILNEGTAYLIRSKVTNNVSTLGGGIMNGPAFFGGSDQQLFLIGSKVRWNTADFGGGIYNKGVVTLSGHARVGGNTAAAVGQGGGIFNDPGMTVVGITGHTFRPANTPDDCVGCGP